MRNLGFYTTAYLNTRLDMHEKALAKRDARQETLEAKLLDLENERTKLLRELNKHRELGEIREARDYSMSQSQKDILRTTQGEKAAPATGGRRGAGSRVNVVSNMESAQDYANAIQEYVALGMEVGAATTRTQNELSGHHANRVINEIIEGKPQNAVAQAGLIAGELSFLPEEVRANVVAQFNDAMVAAGIPGFMLAEDGSLDAQQAQAAAQAANTPEGQAAASRAYNEIQRTIGIETTTEFGLEESERRKQYDRTVREPLVQGISKLGEDIDLTRAELDRLASTRLELDLGPGYRPFGPMFANIRAQRAQLRAMRDMDADQKEVYGLVYDYLRKKPSFAEDSNAMKIASMMKPANAAELLQLARKSAQTGAASVDDIVQAYIQMRQSAQQGQQSIGPVAAQQAELETGDALAASTAEESALLQALAAVTPPDLGGVDQPPAVSMAVEPSVRSKPMDFEEGGFDQQLLVLNNDDSTTYRSSETGQTIDKFTRMLAAGIPKQVYDNADEEGKAALDAMFEE